MCHQNSECVTSFAEARTSDGCRWRTQDDCDDNWLCESLCVLEKLKPKFASRQMWQEHKEIGSRGGWQQVKFKS
jgi:hypothetical protein